MRAVRVARDDFRQLPPHPWRSQRRWSPSSPRPVTRCTPRWTGAAGLVHGSPPRAACHSRSRLPHPRAPVPAAERSRWPLPPPRCGSHGQPPNDYTVIPGVQILPLKPPAVPCGLGCHLHVHPICHSRTRTGRGSGSRSVRSLGRRPQGMGVFPQMHCCIAALGGQLMAAA